MNKNKQDILNEQFKTLPKVIQDTILDSKWQDKIRRVVTNNKLHIDQGAAIENLVLITMLGIETPENFVKNAKEYAQVGDEQAYNISAQVEREIFGDIRKKLIEMTDGSGTVTEIDKATNELGKVSAAIEAAAKKSSSSKPSLKDKIPHNYFEKSDPLKTPPIEIKTPEIVPITAAPVLTTPINIKSEPQPDKYKEPIPPVLKKIDEVQKIEDIIEDDIEDVVISEPEIETSIEPTIIPEIPGEIKMSPPPKAIDIELAFEEKPIEKLPPKPIFIPMPKTIDSIIPTESSLSTKTAQVDPYRESVE